MGYQTYYNITILNNQDKKLTAYLKTELEDISEYNFDIDSNIIGSDGSIKWYEWEANIKELSLLFPDDIILVEGEGEEQGDIWKYYVKNGKGILLKPIITFPEFVESMLEE